MEKYIGLTALTDTHARCVPPDPLTVDKFLAWAVRQKEGKYVLVNGVVVKEPRQNWGHTKTLLQVLRALRENAIRVLYSAERAHRPRQRGYGLSPRRVGGAFA